MSVHAEWRRYGGEHVGLLCRPERAPSPLPAVLVLQEAWSVDTHIEELAHRFAAAGYASFAPDLYPRGRACPEALSQERRRELLDFMNRLPKAAWADADLRDAELARRPVAEQPQIARAVSALFSGLGGLERHLPQLLATTRYLREECDSTRGQRLASVGFAIGGSLSALLACHDQDLSAAVTFYGALPQAELLSQIRCPLLGFYGELDREITDRVPDLARAMAGPRFEWHVYPGAARAFFNDTLPSYDLAAARDAFVRTLAFLQGALS
jgi:carboxymethylenebutenolidase